MSEPLTGSTQPIYPGLPQTQPAPELISTASADKLHETMKDFRSGVTTARSEQAAKKAERLETAKKIGKIALIVFVALAAVGCIVAAPFTGGLSLLIGLSVTLLALAILNFRIAYLRSREI